MLNIVADARNTSLDGLVKTIYQKDKDVLPKALQERAKELLGVTTAKASKEKGPFARKSTEAFAKDLGITAEEITVRTGVNNTIVLADVKAAWKAKKLKNRKTDEKKSSKKAPAPQAAQKKWLKKQEEEAESEDEGSELESESDEE